MQLNPATTALVLIDLQDGILANKLAPVSADDVLAGSIALAGTFRAAGALVVPVTVGWSQGYADAAPGLTDLAPARVADDAREAFARLKPGVAEPGDLRITKRQWGAFTGTELDLQLRRRGISTIAICGVATNMGVESTVRHGWELGYSMVVIEDLCSTFAAEMHDFAVTKIFPRIARVTRSEAIELRA